MMALLSKRPALGPNSDARVIHASYMSRRSCSLSALDMIVM